MANLTIAVDDDVLKAARVRALRNDTSVNAVLREYLEDYAGIAARQRETVDSILALSRRLSSNSGGPRDWTRDDLYE